MTIPASGPAAPQPPTTAPGASDGAGPSCPNCGAEVGPGDSFCEACGTELSPTATPPAAPSDGSAGGLESPITVSRSLRAMAVEAQQTAPVGRPCLNCGGLVGADGYCETCGTKAPSERDHYTETPAQWVAAVCDRGIRHHRNEDATAVAAHSDPGSRAVLVVCDGVSTSLDSDVASLAAARAARDSLFLAQPAGLGTPTSRAGAIARSVEAAAAAANAAVVANTAADSDNAASCTFAAAVIEGDLVVFGNVGDSRVYWVPDLDQPEAAAELSLDDSVAQARIAAGVPREEAENGPQAHAIMKWLGRDSPDFVPRTGAVTLASSGWLLVCSDGLWNYVSEATALQRLIGQLDADRSAPLHLAQALVQWANEQGGKDNISVALARHEVGVHGARPVDHHDTRRS
jgi:serine/threonine protein phosphatase PrpC